MTQKQYARRDDNDFRPIWWNDICTCGHGWEEHRVRVSDVFHDHASGLCEICQCPKFQFDKDNLSHRRKTLVTSGISKENES